MGRPLPAEIITRERQVPSSQPPADQVFWRLESDRQLAAIKQPSSRLSSGALSDWSRPGAEAVV